MNRFGNPKADLNGHIYNKDIERIKNAINRADLSVGILLNALQLNSKVNKDSRNVKKIQDIIIKKLKRYLRDYIGTIQIDEIEFLLKKKYT